MAFKKCYRWLTIESLEWWQDRGGTSDSMPDARKEVMVLNGYSTNEGYSWLDDRVVWLRDVTGLDSYTFNTLFNYACENDLLDVGAGNLLFRYFLLTGINYEAPTRIIDRSTVSTRPPLDKSVLNFVQGNYVRMPRIARGATTEMTITLRLRANKIDTFTTAGTLFGHGDGSNATNGWGFGIFLGISQEIIARFSETGDFANNRRDVATTGILIDNNVERFISVRFTPNNIVIGVDGNNNVATNVTRNDTVNSVFDSNVDYLFGTIFTNGSVDTGNIGNTYQGLLGEVTMHLRNLTDEEVDTIYHTGRHPADIFRHWVNEEGSGNTSFDISPAKNNGLHIGASRAADNTFPFSRNNSFGYTNAGYFDASSNQSASTTGLSATRGAIEFVPYISNIAGTDFIIEHIDDADDLIYFQAASTGAVTYRIGGSVAVVLPAATISNWDLVRLEWDNGTVRIFVNGNVVATDTYIGLNSLAATISIGGISSNQLNGYLREYRLYDDSLQLILEQNFTTLAPTGITNGGATIAYLPAMTRSEDITGEIPQLSGKAAFDGVLNSGTQAPGDPFNTGSVVAIPDVAETASITDKTIEPLDRLDNRYIFQDNSQINNILTNNVFGYSNDSFQDITAWRTRLSRVNKAPAYTFDGNDNINLAADPDTFAGGDFLAFTVNLNSAADNTYIFHKGEWAVAVTDAEDGSGNAVLVFESIRATTDGIWSFTVDKDSQPLGDHLIIIFYNSSNDSNFPVISVNNVLVNPTQTLEAVGAVTDTGNNIFIGSTIANASNFTGLIGLPQISKNDIINFEETGYTVNGAVRQGVNTATFNPGAPYNYGIVEAAAILAGEFTPIDYTPEDFNT